MHVCDYHRLKCTSGMNLHNFQLMPKKIRRPVMNRAEFVRREEDGGRESV